MRLKVTPKELVSLEENRLYRLADQLFYLPFHCLLADQK